MSAVRTIPNLGIRVYAIASIAAGVFDAIWGEFEPAHQPVQAWGDLPGMRILAYLGAAWLIAGGIAMLRSRSTELGAGMLGIIYLAFAVCWLPRFVTAPRVLGAHVAVFIGLIAGVATQLILVVGAMLVCFHHSLVTVRAARWIFGVSSVAFGLAHLTGVQANAGMVPRWMPGGGAFWTVLTGVCFVLAGCAIVAGILEVLAARMLALMLLVFSLVALLPNLFAAPAHHIPWGSNAYNLTAVASAWILADALVEHRAARLRAA